MEVKDKVVLITGASLGIGKSTAILFAKQGAKVIINYNSNEESAKQVLTECNKHSTDNIVIKADITVQSEVDNMFDEISNHYNKLDILVNNAGIFDESDNSRNLEVFEKIFNMNFLAQIRVTNSALEIMKAGKIVNITSIHGKLGHGRPGAIAYSSQKAAFDSYTKNLAKELAPEILVNAVAPGQTLTPMWGEMDKEEEEEKYAASHLIKRFLRPEEIADGILFVAKNDAICGEILAIDGGMTLKTLE